MNTTQGFSLTEVLVSLFLVTTTSLALLTQEWHVSLLFNQTHSHIKTLLQVDNDFERELNA